jgi:AAA family ATP:ADP antiporter
LRRFFDIRSGEGLPVLLAFLYVAFVVAALLLAKPLRNSLFLTEYGPYALAYVYAAVPVVLWLFLAAYSRLAARVGTRIVTVGTLVFFSLNVLAFWYAFTYVPSDWLPAAFYVWVNCFGVIAPVQAWSFANSLFDVRQARRLFALVGAGASLGSIAGGVLARVLVGPMGGTVNMLLVLATLILASAATVVIGGRRMRQRGLLRPRPKAKQPTHRHTLTQTFAEIRKTPYLRLLGALVFMVAIVTQWANFQLSLVAARKFGNDMDALTEFGGTFNFVVGTAGFLLQLFVTAPVLRRFGLPAIVMLLPMFLAFGSTLTLLFPMFWAVVFTNASDQGLRFSIDKAVYELLYLPIPAAQRSSVKNALDIVGNRVADAVGGVLLGLATGGFILPGLGWELQGTASVMLALTVAWLAVAWRIRRAYVETIGESIHKHRIDSERASQPVLDRSVGEALAAKLASDDINEVKYALDVLSTQPLRSACVHLRALLVHPNDDIRRRAISALAAARDDAAVPVVQPLLKDPSLGVRTEALLFLSRGGDIDPLKTIEEIGEFEGYSIRAAMAAFLASPGRARNLEAAEMLLRKMVTSQETSDRLEAARVLALVPEPPLDLLRRLLIDEDAEVSRQALLSTETIGGEAVPVLAEILMDTGAPIDVRREVPAALVRIGTDRAERALMSAVMESDSSLRHRVISALNKVKQQYRPVSREPEMLDLLLAAEIAGHYRSYQLLGALRSSEADNGPVIAALQLTMEQELERIFRLMGLVSGAQGLHDAYVGVRSSNPIVRANALEYLENTLKPELRQVLFPLIDSQVSEEERIRMANHVVGAPVESAEQALGTLLASEDPWLRSRAEYAWQRLTGEAEPVEHTPAPVMDVGAG